LFINVPSQQPNDQLQKLYNAETQLTKDNKQDTDETDKIKKVTGKVHPRICHKGPEGE